jgi:hypothetical protein
MWLPSPQKNRVSKEGDVLKHISFNGERPSLPQMFGIALCLLKWCNKEVDSHHLGTRFISWTNVVEFVDFTRIKIAVNSLSRSLLNGAKCNHIA